MGTESKAESGFSEAEALVDFLYIDKERIDSFISQTRHGTLRTVVKKTGASQGSSLAAGVGAIAKGEIKHEGKTDNSAEESYDPYHSLILDLLNDIGVHPLASLPADCNGKLALIGGRVSIRDVATIKSLMPIISKNGNALGVPAGKQERGMMKVMADMLGQMPDSILMSIVFDGHEISGTLKGSGLAIRQDDLMRTYGVTLPGGWYVLGILDKSRQDTQHICEVSSMESAIDALTTAMHTLYSSTPYKIIPILIFRRIEVSQG